MAAGASRTSPALLIGSYGSGARPILKPIYTQLISNGSIGFFWRGEFPTTASPTSG